VQTIGAKYPVAVWKGHDDIHSNIGLEKYKRAVKKFTNDPNNFPVMEENIESSFSYRILLPTDINHDLQHYRNIVNEVETFVKKER